MAVFLNTLYSNVLGPKETTYPGKRLDTPTLVFMQPEALRLLSAA